MDFRSGRREPGVLDVPVALKTRHGHGHVLDGGGIEILLLRRGDEIVEGVHEGGALALILARPEDRPPFGLGQVDERGFAVLDWPLAPRRGSNAL